MRRCDFACSNPGAVDLYWDPALTACEPCARKLASYLDLHDCWPEPRLQEVTSALTEVEGVGLVLTVLTASVDPSCGALLLAFAQALDSQGVRVGPGRTGEQMTEWYLDYTEPVSVEVRAVGDCFRWILLAAWALQGTHSLRLCEHCDTPFLLKTSQRTKCPVCHMGNRVQRVSVPFMPKPKQRTT